MSAIFLDTGYVLALELAGCHVHACVGMPKSVIRPSLRGHQGRQRLPVDRQPSTPSPTPLQKHPQMLPALTFSPDPIATRDSLSFFLFLCASASLRAIPSSAAKACPSIPAA